MLYAFVIEAKALVIEIQWNFKKKVILELTKEIFHFHAPPQSAIGINDFNRVIVMLYYHILCFMFAIEERS